MGNQNANLSQNDLVNVTLILKKNNQELKDNIKIQKGCSFENGNSIYYAAENGELSVFDKSQKKWTTTTNNIVMDEYQYSVFKAVANNKFDKINDKIEGIILSKDDIDIAMTMKSKDLNNDLNKFLSDKTETVQVQGKTYNNMNGLITHIYDSINRYQENYIFKYGKKNSVLSLSAKAEKIKRTQINSTTNVNQKPNVIKTDTAKQSKSISQNKQKVDPTHKDYVSVNIIAGKNVRPVKIEKGCSFENKKFIYRVEESGELKAYDKKTKQWTKCDNIAMTNYQYDTFRAVANNRFERTNGEIIDIILSKKDIELAMSMNKNDLKKDLQQFLRIDDDARYEAVDIKQYSKEKGISAYITNNNSKTSGRLIFTFGNRANTESLSSKETKSKSNNKNIKKTKIEPSFGQKLKNIFQTSIPKYDGIEIHVKRKYRPFIENISSRTGYSEVLLSMIINQEGYTREATWKNEGGRGGLWEYGFGHTTKAPHNNKFGKGDTCSLKEAFKLLEQDIIDMENEIKKYANKYYKYDNLPQSLKDAFIDVAFNRGPHRADPDSSRAYTKDYDRLQRACKAGDYAAAAVYLRQSERSMASENINGLRKRNVNRFLLAIRDLPAKDKIRAMDLFNKNGYYDRTLRGLSNKNERETFKKNWENIYNTANKELKKQKLGPCYTASTFFNNFRDHLKF